MKVDKKQILQEVIQALMDNNNQVMVETVEGRPDREILGNWSSVIGDNSPSVPLPKELGASANRMHAKSIKIGHDITLKKINDDNFVVRTPNGEASFDGIKDEQFNLIWGAVLNKYENSENSNFMYPVRTYMKDDDLRHQAGGAIKPGDKVSKFEKAKERLRKLGIDPKHIEQYIANQHQNG